MNILTIHSAWTLLIFISFIGVVVWAYSSRQKSRFDEAANLIFDDEPTSTPTNKEGTK